MRRIAVGLALTSIALGGVATAVWWRFGDAGAFAAVPAEILLSLLAGLVTLSMLNLSIRWVRWHFLTRRFIRTIPTVASLRLYFGTLIAFATPDWEVLAMYRFEGDKLRVHSERFIAVMEPVRQEP